MVILGLILILLALALGFLAWYGLPTATTQIGWDFLGNHLQISPVTVFFLGAGSMLGLMLGLWLLSLGTKRSARKSRELRELKKSQKEQARLDQQRVDQQRREEQHHATAATTERTVTERTDGAHLGTDRDYRDGDRRL